MALEKIVKNSSGVPTGEYEEIAGGTLWADSPIGTILAFGGADAPAGWMICDGTSLLRASYPELFAVIGTAFGSADSTHFNIPDMRESVPKGAGLTGHTVGAHLDADGLAVGEFLDDRIQDHIHRFSSDNSNVGTANCAREGGAVSQNNITPDSEVKNARTGVTTEVKSVGVNYIIKAKMVALPADLASGVEEYINDNAKSPVSVSNKLVTESDLNTVTSGNATRNTTYVSSTGFNATWNKTGRVCMASLTFNLAQNTTSTEEVITGFPAPIADVDIVAQGASNTAVSNLVLKTNGNIRTHYGGTANQFYQVTFTYITAS